MTVVASTCSLITSLSGTFSDGDHTAYIARHWTDVVEQMVRRVDELRDRDPALDARFIDIAYDDLVAEPIRPFAASTITSTSS